MPELTNDELVRFVENINYEFAMMRHARDLEVSGHWDAEDPTGWLAAEAALVHCRNLIDFFRGSNGFRNENRPNDVIAWDYARGWDPRRTADLLRGQGAPSDLSQRINTRVMHLGRGRETTSRIDFVRLTSAIEAIWEEWRKKLNRDWSDQFER